MSLLDSIKSQVTGALGGQNAAGGADWMGVIGNLINNPQTGGLQGLAEKLSGLLPQVVNQLTPIGCVPEQGDLLSKGMGMLSSFLK
jgi:uncharacterized protein YidB (DUF937 family)